MQLSEIELKTCLCGHLLRDHIDGSRAMGIFPGCTFGVNPYGTSFSRCQCTGFKESNG